jgi:hypothetical protein
MRILILGASGLIGLQLAARLLQRGGDVVGVARRVAEASRQLPRAAWLPRIRRGPRHPLADDHPPPAAGAGGRGQAKARNGSKWTASVETPSCRTTGPSGPAQPRGSRGPCHLCRRSGTRPPRRADPTLAIERRAALGRAVVACLAGCPRSSADAATAAAVNRYRVRKLHARLKGTRLIRTPPFSVTSSVSLGLTPIPRAVS